MLLRVYFEQQQDERGGSLATIGSPVAGRWIRAVDPSLSRQTSLDGMIKRASRTCYFLNRRARYLALIRRGVRLPVSIGVWIPIANPDRTARETIALLDATYPQLDAPGLTFITLLNDFAVGEFEKELRQRELLRRQKGRER